MSEVHVWVGRAWGRQSDEDAKKNGDIVSVRERPEGSSPIPKGLDWDLWLGPAPARPFHEVYLPGPKWYRWWDFGNGTMSDLGSTGSTCRSGPSSCRSPRTIEAFGPPPHPEIAPASMHVVYEYEAQGEQPGLRLTWYQGADKPEPWKTGAIPKWDSGVLFVGAKGMLLSDYGKHVLLPEKDFQDFKRPEPFIPKSLGHHAEWIHACKTGEPTTCAFAYSGLADRGQSPGERRLPRGQEAGVGCRQAVRQQCARGRAVHPARVPQGVDAGVSGPSLDQDRRRNAHETRIVRRDSGSRAS